MSAYNTFESLKPNFKESYADKPKKFQKTRKVLSGIGLSIAKADKNPKKFLKDIDMNIGKFKGIIV